MEDLFVFVRFLFPYYYFSFTNIGQKITSFLNFTKTVLVSFLFQFTCAGRFKSGMENFSDKCKPLSPQELMELLKAKDHENEVKDVDNLSKEALDSLLDRSDLYAKWKDQEEAHKSHNQGTKGTGCPFNLLPTF